MLKIAEREPYQGDPLFDLERAEAWRNVCYLYSGLCKEAECEAAKNEVLKIADVEPYQGDRRFDFHRAVAWRHVCRLYANLGNEASCKEAKRQVFEIVNIPKYSNEKDFLEEMTSALRAWQSVAGETLS